MAIVVPILLLLVFGIIEFGFLFYRQIGINQGVREAARATVVANYASSGCAGTPAQQIACLADNRAGFSGTKSYVHVEVAGKTGVGDQITVCSDYPETSITGLMSGFLPNHLTSKVTMRLEQAIPTLADGGDATFPNPANCHAS
jgi:Flp pilus assembly protein TadG